MNKQAELTRWTPKRLLSLLMALIMTLSLLPTAALAATEVGNGATYTFDPTITGIKRIDNPDGSITLVQPIYAVNTLTQIADGYIDENKSLWGLKFSIAQFSVDKPGDTIEATVDAYLDLKGSTNAKITEVFVTDDKTGSGWGHRTDTTRTGNITVGEDGCARFTLSLKYEVNGTETYAKSTHVVIMSLWTGYNVTYTNDNGGTFTGVPAGNTAKTVAKDADNGNYEQVYQIPAGAKASKNGYTFKGWYVTGSSSLGDMLSIPYQPGTTIAGIKGDIQLSANLEENQTIKFNPVYSGVSGLPFNYEDISQGQTYTIPYTPELSGYDFKGWTVTGATLEADGVSVKDITSPITITPKWEKSDGSAPVGSHKVTFYENASGVYNMPAPQTVKHDEKAAEPIAPERKGYTFDGWYDSAGTKYNFADPVTTDLELYAKWTAKKITINITDTNALIGATDVVFQNLTPHPSIDSEAHFTIKVPDKYNTSDLLVWIGEMHTAQTYLVPVARAETADGVTLYYQFPVTDDMADPTTVVIGPVTEKTFTVMMPTGHFDAEITSPTHPTTPPTGTVSAAAADKKSASIVYGDSYTFTVTPKQGYDVAVYVNGVAKNAGADGKYTVTNVTGPQRVEVVESAIPNYNVTFTVPQSGELFTQSVMSGGKATKPAVAPIREGYKFDGWYAADQYPNGNQFDFDTLITKDTVLFGKLTPKIYQISYNANTTDTVTNMPTANQDKTHGLAVQLDTAKPTRDGYTFLGWGTTADATAPSYQPGDMYSVDGDIELYAVWQQKTYTITFSSGEGYTLHSGHGSMTVEHGGNFDFNLIVAPAYAENEPEVWTNTTGVGTGSKLTNPVAYTNPVDGSKQYHYMLTNVKADTAVNVKVTANATYTVTFMTGTDVYQTQQVEFNHKATQPVDPKVEGFTFGGWYKDAGLTTPWDFATEKVIGPTTIYAKLDPITPKITWPSPTTGYTIAVKYTAPGAPSAADLTTNGGPVPYNSVVTFTITISTGYDASQMQVGINGVLLSPKEINGDTYTFEFTATQDTKITVVGVERKTVTITYYDNARDDTSNSLAPQIANYYVENATDNSTFTKQAPVRTGYTFLGWSTDGTATEATYKWTDIKSDSGLTIKFTKDTALYAIWKADALTAELIITDEFTSAPSGTTISGSKLEYAYEGDSITLVGKLSADAQGTMTFYKKAKTATDWTFLGTTSINGGNYGVLGTTVENYKWGNADDAATKSNYRWDYKVEFKPTTDEGYSPCDASDDLRVYSKAISWEVDKKTDKTNFDWIKAQNELTIYTDEARTAATDKMTANSTYWLQIPAVYELDGGLNLKNNNITKLSVGTHYEITWEYEDSANHWTTYTTTSDTDWVKVTPEYSGYSFRAKVTPTQSSIYTKAATYDENGTVVKDVYWDYLITKATAKTEKQATATELAITGADAENSVTIAGTSVTTGLAQFEGKKVTLTAKVTDTTANAGVKSGEVKFFRYVDGTNDELLNTTLISVDSNGVATCEVEISKWTDGKSVTENKDEFYAVYQPNATYDTSASWTTAAGELKAVYIKSTTIKTPIIESTLANDAGDKATTYIKDLTGLLAGVQHEFKLRTGNAEPDWSVVALDGRTVAAENYTIQWITKSGDNAETTAATDSKFKTSDNKVGDEIYVRLNPTGDMKTGADSKKAIIGKKQDVTVTVEASDEINSTAETDVYQLNDITLTATVAAKETTSTMKPTGTVAFYYSVDNGTTWTKIGDAKDLAEVAGVMTASIQTDQLPVKAGDNTKQDVEITAVYEGNETFNASATVTGAEQYTITAATGCTTNNDTVTVYSSVVYVKDTVENKTTVVSTKTHESGIYIYAEDDKVLANEGNVNLKLSEVYTLDHDIPLSKLTYNTDYTVQWQMLTNAAAYPDKAKENTPWTNITSATGTTCQINVEKGAAYRAVITVNDTPIAKGSYEKIDQGTVGTADKNDGRQVYYSNILVAANAPATLTVNVNTDNTSKGYEGIVEGETVTIHTFTSGATGTTPISKLTVDIYEGKSPAAGATPVFTAEKANVNGHVSFDWNKDVTPGYYTLKVKATFTNGYDDKEITRTLIVRDNDYKFELSGDNAVYNGKVQDLKVTVADMGIENALAQKSVVVYYYTDEARTQQVEPTQAGTYYATVRLQESAYWTEKTFPATFTIKPREVSVVDLVAQAKVYDGTNNANIQEIILNDAEVNSTTGLPTDDKGIIDGDSVYAVGTGYTSQSHAGTATLSVKDVTLKGDDAANYEPTSHSYYNIEDFNIQRSQVKGAIVSGRTYKYTGKDIKLAASDIYLIDQAGSQLTDYDVTYYYHNGDGVEQVDAMNKMGKYTVIARPEQNNYKGGATETVYVGTTDNAGTLTANAVSSLITISNTVELYGAAGNKGIVATATNNATVTVQYQNGTGWSDARPTDAGRYLVKVTATNGSVTDTAYGIYTIVKARPEFTPTTDKSSMEYTSGRYDGAIGAGFVNGKSNDTAETYITYTGGTIQGVAYEAPTEVGKYIATVHVGETANYTAHEKQVAFEITPKALTITADDISRQQYGAYPDLTASFKGLATGGVAADTSLRDVQIQPELIDKSNYTNDASDQVGNNYKIIAVAALARNYTVSYVDGNMSVTREDPKPYLEIRGMIENGDGATDLAYYGDVIQLYAYGNQNKTTTGDVYNTSSVLTWEVTTGPATITQDGLLTVTGVGDVTVTLKRGIGAQQISTTLTFTAKKQEVKVVVPDQDLIYNGAEQKYDGGKFYAENAKGERITATPYMHDGKVKRTNVGSQIITSWVGDTNATYQSEHYCGLFTINVKDVTVKPKEISAVIYGDALGTLDYTPIGTVGGVAALTDGKAVSEREDYKNLDVLDGYEILVAGRENENYNVKYVTDQDAPDVEVKEKTLTISTGTLNEQTGMTSGSLNPMGKYPVNGAAIDDSAPAMGPSNVRMYGEPNWVMDKDPVTLISGDTLADLAALNDKLVSFNYNIGADANVSYTDKATKLTVSGSPMPDYKVFTDDSMMAFKNYDETYTLGTQNIYQRPVTLSVPSGMTLTAYKPSILDSSNQVKNDVLLNLLLNNLIVSKYNNEGGLAELLKHTIKDLDIRIKSTQVTGDKLTVKIALGNQNYWLDPASSTIEIELVSTKIVPVYSPLDWTSFTVTMYNETKTTPVAISGNVRFFIFQKKDGVELKYSNYKNDTIIRSGLMDPTGRTGEFRATFSRLPAGDYAIFAIAENYTIVE